MVLSVVPYIQSSEEFAIMPGEGTGLSSNDLAEILRMQQKEDAAKIQQATSATQNRGVNIRTRNFAKPIKPLFDGKNVVDALGLSASFTNSESLADFDNDEVSLGSVQNLQTVPSVSESPGLLSILTGFSRSQSKVKNTGKRVGELSNKASLQMQAVKEPVRPTELRQSSGTFVPANGNESSAGKQRASFLGKVPATPTQNSKRNLFDAANSASGNRSQSFGLFSSLRKSDSPKPQALLDDESFFSEMDKDRNTLMASLPSLSSAEEDTTTTNLPGSQRARERRAQRGNAKPTEDRGSRKQSSSQKEAASSTLEDWLPIVASSTNVPLKAPSIMDHSEHSMSSIIARRRPLAKETLLAQELARKQQEELKALMAQTTETIEMLDDVDESVAENSTHLETKRYWQDVTGEDNDAHEKKIARHFEQSRDESSDDDFEVTRPKSKKVRKVEETMKKQQEDLRAVLEQTPDANEALIAKKVLTSKERKETKKPRGEWQDIAGEATKVATLRLDRNDADDEEDDQILVSPTRDTRRLEDNARKQERQLRETVKGTPNANEALSPTKVASSKERKQLKQSKKEWHDATGGTLSLRRNGSDESDEEEADVPKKDSREARKLDAATKRQKDMVREALANTATPGSALDTPSAQIESQERRDTKIRADSSVEAESLSLQIFSRPSTFNSTTKYGESKSIPNEREATKQHNGPKIIEQEPNIPKSDLGDKGHNWHNVSPRQHISKSRKRYDENDDVKNNKGKDLEKQKRTSEKAKSNSPTPIDNARKAKRVPSVDEGHNSTPGKQANEHSQGKKLKKERKRDRSRSKSKTRKPRGRAKGDQNVDWQRVASQHAPKSSIPSKKDDQVTKNEEKSPSKASSSDRIKQKESRKNNFDNTDLMQTEGQWHSIDSRGKSTDMQLVYTETDAEKSLRSEPGKSNSEPTDNSCQSLDDQDSVTSALHDDVNLEVAPGGWTGIDPNRPGSGGRNWRATTLSPSKSKESSFGATDNKATRVDSASGQSLDQGQHVGSKTTNDTDMTEANGGWTGIEVNRPISGKSGWNSKSEEETVPDLVVEETRKKAVDSNERSKESRDDRRIRGDTNLPEAPGGWTGIELKRQDRADHYPNRALDGEVATSPKQTENGNLHQRSNQNESTSFSRRSDENIGEENVRVHNNPKLPRHTGDNPSNHRETAVSTLELEQTDVQDHDQRHMAGEAIKPDNDNNQSYVETKQNVREDGISSSDKSPTPFKAKGDSVEPSSGVEIIYEGARGPFETRPKLNPFSYRPPEPGPFASRPGARKREESELDDESDNMTTQSEDRHIVRQSSRRSLLKKQVHDRREVLATMLHATKETTWSAENEVLELKRKLALSQALVEKLEIENAQVKREAILSTSEAQSVLLTQRHNRELELEKRIQELMDQRNAAVLECHELRRFAMNTCDICRMRFDEQKEFVMDHSIRNSILSKRKIKKLSAFEWFTGGLAEETESVKSEHSKRESRIRRPDAETVSLDTTIPDSSSLPEIHNFTEAPFYWLSEKIFAKQNDAIQKRNVEQPMIDEVIAYTEENENMPSQDTTGGLARETSPTEGVTGEEERRGVVAEKDACSTSDLVFTQGFNVDKSSNITSYDQGKKKGDSSAAAVTETARPIDHRLSQSHPTNRPSGSSLPKKSFLSGLFGERVEDEFASIKAQKPQSDILETIPQSGAKKSFFSSLFGERVDDFTAFARIVPTHPPDPKPANEGKSKGGAGLRGEQVLDDMAILNSLMSISEHKSVKKAEDEARLVGLNEGQKRQRRLGLSEEKFDDEYRDEIILSPMKRSSAEKQQNGNAAMPQEKETIGLRAEKFDDRTRDIQLLQSLKASEKDNPALISPVFKKGKMQSSTHASGGSGLSPVSKMASPFTVQEMSPRKRVLSNKGRRGSSAVSYLGRFSSPGNPGRDKSHSPLPDVADASKKQNEDGTPRKTKSRMSMMNQVPMDVELEGDRPWRSDSGKTESNFALPTIGGLDEESESSDNLALEVGTEVDECDEEDLDQIAALLAVEGS